MLWARHVSNYKHMEISKVTVFVVLGRDYMRIHVGPCGPIWHHMGACGWPYLIFVHCSSDSVSSKVLSCLDIFLDSKAWLWPTTCPHTADSPYARIHISPYGINMGSKVWAQYGSMWAQDWSTLLLGVQYGPILDHSCLE